MIFEGSIRLRFLVPLVGLIMLLVVSASAIFIHHEADSLEGQLARKQALLEDKMQEKARSMTTNLILVVERALAQYDFTYIRTVVDQGAKEISELAHLSITDQQGVVLFSSNPEMMEQRLVFPDHQTTHKTLWHGQPVLEINRPVKSAGDVWGTMVLVLTFDALDREMEQSRVDMGHNIQEVWRLAWVLGTFFIIMGVLIVVWTVRHVTAPLLVLTEAAGRVTGNIAGMEIPDFPGKGEIAILSRVFRQMLARIRSHLDELQEVNLSLECKVKERTQDLAQQAEKLAVLNRNMIDSIQYAKNIQNAILPKLEQIGQVMADYFVAWHPKDIVGGDFYWLRAGRDRDEGYLVAVADCTGHGVPGALMAMAAYSILREIVTYQNFDNPALILKLLNRSLRIALGQDCHDAASDDGLDIGLCHVNPRRSVVIFAGARQNFYYVLDECRVETIQGDRHSIGYKKSNPDFEFKNHVVAVRATTQCYLASDGFYDQCGGDKGYSFDTDRFKALIAAHHHRPNCEQGALFIDTLRVYQGAVTQMDDITMIGFRVGA